LLLHVVDCADPAHGERIQHVDAVLEAIGANGLPVIHVYNKADILAVQPRLDRAETGMPQRVWVSAQTGAGMELLLAAIAEFLFLERVRGLVRLDVGQARLRALLFEKGKVWEECCLSEGGWEIDVELDQRDFDQLVAHEKLSWHERNHPDGLERIG